MARDKVKQEFVMLAHDHEPDRHGYSGYIMSEKFDGGRAIWDGGLSRGLPCASVPYANTAKHERYREIRYATGLWTRYGQPIYAPESFLDNLPKHVCLDGELSVGRGRHQDTMKAMRSLDSMSPYWAQMKYFVFDAPSYRELFKDRKLNSAFFRKELYNIAPWLMMRGLEIGLGKADAPFYQNLAFLRNLGLSGQVVVADQHTLPQARPDAERILAASLQTITDIGGEGIMLRTPTSFWRPERSHDLLKVKKYRDMEGTVVGYKWSALTDLDKSLTGIATNKLEGLMGSIRLRLDNGKEFDLGCGFTEAERQMSESVNYVPGGEVPKGVENPKFPIGSQLTFKYREFTDDGLPKEASHWRKTV